MKSQRLLQGSILIAFIISTALGFTLSSYSANKLTSLVSSTCKFQRTSTLQQLKGSSFSNNNGRKRSSVSMQLGGTGSGFQSSQAPQEGGVATTTASSGRGSYTIQNSVLQSGGTPSFDGLAAASTPQPTATLYSSRAVELHNPQELALDISEDMPRNIYNLETWGNENGIQKCNGFTLTQEVDNDKEVYVSTNIDISSGSPVLFAPEGLILSSSKAMDELRSPEMYEAEQLLINTADGDESQLSQYYLMLKILVEIQKGTDSNWYQWLNSLPRYFSNAGKSSMTDYCLLCLPPLMKTLAGEEQDKQRMLCNKDSLDKVPFLSESIKSSNTYIEWAYQIVSTRTILDENTNEYKIIPLADYFNHGSEYTEITSSYDNSGNYYAYTSYDVPGGSPLRISYAGTNVNNPSHLLARYGFLDEDTPATYCKLLPPTVNQDMLDLGYSYEKMLFYRTGEVADEVWDIFLYDALSSVNSNEQQALMNAHRTGDYTTKLALHEKYYSETSSALLAHIDDFLQDIDKLIHKAETVGVNDPDSPYIKYEHPRLPLIHRHNLFVRETFQAVRDLYSPDAPIKWREATRFTVQECDEVAMECAMAECVEDMNTGNWECEGGLGQNADGSDRPYKTQQIIMKDGVPV